MKWRIVPFKPTDEMICKAEEAQARADELAFKRGSVGARGEAERHYRFMVAAAPEFEPDDEMVERAAGAICRQRYNCALADLLKPSRDFVRADARHILRHALGGEPKP